jgi:hypothetical protein
MPDRKNVFISHVHEDDAMLPELKDLIARAGIEMPRSQAGVRPAKPERPDAYRERIFGGREFGHAVARTIGKGLKP